MYASKPQINRDLQKVRFHKQIHLPNGLLTLKILSKYVNENETFSITEDDPSVYGTKIILHIYGERYETQKEMEHRIVKEEKYSENYHKHHAKYGRK